MPALLPISDSDRARRHVLGQQLYRLRRRYKYLLSMGLYDNADRVLWDIRVLAQEYEHVGGQPHHKGNVL